MSHFINSRRKKVRRIIDRYRLKDSNFTLFSNDCWGAEVYKHLNLPYNTPFVGLMMMVPCYIKVLSNPKYYLAQDLIFQKKSNYKSVNELRERWEYRFPIAALDGAEIQFLHYASESDALEKWIRRVQRINWDRIFVKFDGNKDCATYELINTFNHLPYPRLTLLKEKFIEIDSGVILPNYTADGKEQFNLSLRYIDLVGWLNGNSIQSGLQSKIYKSIFY